MAPRHSRVTSSTTLRMRKRRPFASWSWMKSSDQRGIGLCVYKDRSPRSQSFPAAFPLAHGQSLLAIESIDAIDAGRLAFASEQDEETAITEPPTLIRKLA